MTRSLDAGQSAVAATLHELLEVLHTPPRSEALAGERETYLVVDVLDLRLWVYPEGLEISGPGVDRRFERFDYDTRDQLEAAFFSELRTLIEERRRLADS